MDFYQSLGGLILGSRLRRVSEYFIAEVNKVYEYHGIEFEAGWFPLFFLLSTREELSIKAISATLSVSHSASSQLVSQLRKKDLVALSRSSEDGRKQLVRLSEKGTQVLAQVRPLWDAVRDAMQEILEGDRATAALLPAITALENKFAAQPLSERLISHTKLTPTPHE